MWEKPASISYSESSFPGLGKSYRHRLLACSLLCWLAMSLVYLAKPLFLQQVKLRTGDFVTSFSLPLSSADMVAVNLVAIDDASLERYGQWPWPRHKLAVLLDTVLQAGAKTVGMIMIFPEKDRTSPGHLLDRLGNEYADAIDTTSLPHHILDHDTRFADSIRQQPVVMGHEFVFSGGQAPKMSCTLHPVTIKTAAEEGGRPVNGIHTASSVICNNETLARAVSASGFLNGVPDLDGQFRRLPLLIRYDDMFYPSISLAVLMQYYQIQELGFQSSVLRGDRLTFGSFELPIDGRANFILAPNPETAPGRISAVQLLDGQLSDFDFTDSIVLIGLSASGLDHRLSTPFGSISSLDIHRWAIQSMLADHKTVGAAIHPFYEILLAFAGALLLALIVSHFSSAWGLALSFLLFLFFISMPIFLYRSTGHIISPLLPGSMLVFGSTLLYAYKYKLYQEDAVASSRAMVQVVKSKEEALQSILNTVPDIIFRLDHHGNIIYISPAVRKYMVSSQPLIGRPVLSLVAPEDVDRAQYKINERRTGERATFDLELRLLLRTNGEDSRERFRYFSVSAEGIYQNDEPSRRTFLGTQGIVRDITEKKKLEIQLLQAQKMEVIGNLAAGIAHDLNNILSGLVSYPQLLLTEIPENSPMYQKVSLIQQSGKKAAAIVQDLLSLARSNVEAFQACNLNAIVDDYLQSAEFTQTKGKFAAITISTRLPDDLWNCIGSPVHLSKVIMNLLQNSMEAMPAGGVIEISTANLSLSEGVQGYETIPPGDYVQCQVSDEGVGVEPTEIARIFEPFFSKKAMSSSGTGLGMTVIWSTVKDHKGYIDVASETGKGTTFTFYLPKTDRTAVTVGERVVLEDYIGTETILIVDDIAEQLAITANMLAKLGYKTITAGSSVETLDILSTHRVDLVILDMIMSNDLDGLELYRKILEYAPGQRAVIASGFSESDRVKQVMELGGGAYLQKPFTMEQLGMAVRGEIDRKA